METVSCLFGMGLKFLFNRLQKINCIDFVGVAVHSQGGKSTLAKSLQATRDNALILDLEENVKISLTEEKSRQLQAYKNNMELSTYNSLFYIYAKEFVETLRKNYPKRRIILLSSDPELLKYCVKNIKILACITSNELFTKILNNQTNEEIKKLIEQTRTNLMTTNYRKAFIYNNFDDLTRFICEKLDLKNKL